MGIFANTTYLEFFTSNLVLNRYSFLVSTCLLTVLTILHITNLYRKSNLHKKSENIADKSIEAEETSHSNIYALSKNIKSFSAIATISRIITVYKRGKQEKYVILSHLMTITTMIFFIFHGVVDTLDFYGKFHGLIACRSVRILAAIFWHCGKTAMYFLFYARLQLAFYDTAFQYSNRIVYGLLFLIWNFSISCMVGDAFEILGEVRYDSYYQIWWCQQFVPLWGCIATPIFDSFISLLCLYLFIAPLYKLVSHCDKLDNLTIFVSTITKYTVLTFIAVSTTTLVLTIQIFKSYGVIICFDVVVNVISIMLMSTVYNEYYKVLCRCTEICTNVIIAKIDNQHKKDEHKKETDVKTLAIDSKNDVPKMVKLERIKSHTGNDDVTLEIAAEDVMVVTSDISGNKAMIL